MRIVVVGATGNVGTSLVRSLAGDDRVDTIIGVARRAPSWQPPRTRWVTADVAHDDLTPVFEGVDAVVHLAWLFQPTHDPIVTWRANVLGSIRLFGAVVQARVPALVHASSVGAYSPSRDDVPVEESWPTHALPTAAYGREKSYVERILDDLEHRHPELRIVRMRPGFTFQHRSATAQRRLFAGPLVPNLLGNPALVPVVPDLSGLRFQTLQADDAAAAYHRAVVADVHGAFNLAAGPIVDAAMLAELLDARVVKVPRGLVRGAVAAAWRLRAVPASPTLLDLFLSLPVMDTTRARNELGWEPRWTSTDAIRAFLEGLRAGAGYDTPPLAEDTMPRRLAEVATGVGQRDRPQTDRSPSDRPTTE